MQIFQIVIAYYLYVASSDPNMSTETLSNRTPTGCCLSFVLPSPSPGFFCWQTLHCLHCLFKSEASRSVLATPKWPAILESWVHAPLTLYQTNLIWPVTTIFSSTLLFSFIAISSACCFLSSTGLYSCLFDPSSSSSLLSRFALGSTSARHRGNFRFWAFPFFCTVAQCGLLSDLQSGHVLHLQCRGFLDQASVLGPTTMQYFETQVVSTDNEAVSMFSASLKFNNPFWRGMICWKNELVSSYVCFKVLDKCNSCKQLSVGGTILSLWFIHDLTCIGNNLFLTVLDFWQESPHSETGTISAQYEVPSAPQISKNRCTGQFIF